ncbi:MAG TPA: amidohydrolase family protein [Acidimicrobiales bacterium]|nr:amidohydrolase family protein [Acidimicrobiales bacterium]
MERIISADSHVSVQHDQVKANLARTHHEAYDAAVAEFYRWFLGGGFGSAAAANRSGLDIYNRALGRPGNSDPKARLADMDADGIDTEVMYCELSAYRYLYMVEDGAEPATRAFNDTLHQFASECPERLVVNYQIPINDIDEAVSEVARVAAMGGRSLQLPVFPREVGMPDYHDERYDRLWAAVQETDLPLCFHIGLNTAVDDIARRDPTPRLGLTVPCIPPTTTEALGMWLLTGVLERFPELKLVFVEPGLGWVAWYLYFVDDMVRYQGYEYPAIKELPSHYYARNVNLTFIKEPDAIDHLRHRLGTANLLWSTDYPHPVTSWPHSQDVIAEQFRSVSAEDRALMLCGNAQRVWGI